MGEFLDRTATVRDPLRSFDEFLEKFPVPGLRGRLQDATIWQLGPGHRSTLEALPQALGLGGHGECGGRALRARVSENALWRVWFELTSLLTKVALCASGVRRHHWKRG